jgi:hypothetical protein
MALLKTIIAGLLAVSEALLVESQTAVHSTRNQRYDFIGQQDPIKTDA